MKHIKALEQEKNNRQRRLSELSSRIQNFTSATTHEEIEDLLKDTLIVSNIQRQKLMEEIKEKTGVPLLELKSFIAGHKKTTVPDQLQLAQIVITNVGKENILTSVSNVWLWSQSGVWKTISDRELKKITQDALKAQDVSVSRSLVDGVVDILKSETFKPEHSWNALSNIINTQNVELFTREKNWFYCAHHREHYLTCQIPIQFDSNATCPRFMMFLDEIFEGDLDAPEKKKVILEMLGYSLVNHTEYESFVMLVGTGANGKSVLLDVIRKLLGPENVSAVQPSQFSNKFQRAHLHLKLANLVTEIPEGHVIADAELKSIVSGELTTVEHKNKDPFDFKPFATCWFGTNHMPHTRDFSEGLLRRAIIIPFNKQFKPGVNADPNLKEKLYNELPGILNVALEAFKGVIVNGKFTEPQSCHEAKQEWRLQSDQVAQFVDEKCALEPQLETASNMVYSLYKLWAMEAGIRHKLNHKNFTTRLMKLGVKTKRGTGGTRMLVGIGLREANSDTSDTSKH